MNPRLLFLAASLAPLLAAAADDLLIADFEGDTYGDWKASGAAFGDMPARGTLPNQMPVEGFAGRGLANSFRGGDDSTGALISPPFTIGRQFITFLIGGGGWADETCVNLLVDGKAVRTAVGPNTAPGGTERLAPVAWDVSEFRGRSAAIQIIDQRRGGWGHINVDQLVQTDDRKAAPLSSAKPMNLIANASREIAIEKAMLNFPLKTGVKRRRVSVLADGVEVRWFEAELADAEPEWWSPLDVSAWRGKTLTVRVDKLPEDSRALAQIEQSDSAKGQENLYREALRPQFHFSAQRGWLNDPNGMVFHHGEWHLFFQHDPFTWGGATKFWGHAVSRDLVHWKEVQEALYPDALGAMWSGSGVVDWKNTSGFGNKGGEPPLALIYTAAGKEFGQCVAFSNDARAFTKYDGNPVVKQITGGNRDPKVMWHEPTQKWVLTFYVEKPQRKHTVHFFTSPNLRDWTLASIAEGGSDPDHFLFECPDFFELPVDGNSNDRRWVIAGANTEYQVGTFDGTRFTPEGPKQPGHRGRGFYAPQTFSDAPEGRRIQIGWLLAATPGMPFNQCMSLPLELGLKRTAEGVRLTYAPVKELAALREKSHALPAFTLKPGDTNPLEKLRGEMLEVRAEIEPGAASVVTWTVRGVPIRYDAARQELSVRDHRASAPLRNGRLQLAIYLDRTAVEIFASDGLTYMPMPVIPDANDRTITISVTGDPVQVHTSEVHELGSIWR